MTQPAGPRSRPAPRMGPGANVADEQQTATNANPLGQPAPGAGAPRGAGGAAGSGEHLPAAGAAARTAGNPGNLGASDLWQLATWAVSPPEYDSEWEERRARVREIMLALVDEIAPAS